MPVKKSTKQIDQELDAWLQQSPRSPRVIESSLLSRPKKTKVKTKARPKTATRKKAGPKTTTKVTPRKTKPKTASRKKPKTKAAAKTTPRKTKPKAPRKISPRTTRLQPAPGPVPLDKLALVLNAVTNMPMTGRFGDKVYISEIWRRVGRRIAPTLFDFKRWLLEQNRFGNLVLARGDLMGAMDASKVSESEIQDRGATFHFVLDPAFSW
jgi:hypothetical protein